MAALAQVPNLTGLPLPVTIRPAFPLTDEELMALSESNRPLRIEQNAQGELEIMSPTGGEGSYFEALVVGALVRWAEEFGGIPFATNGGFRLRDGSILSPDGPGSLRRAGRR